MNDADHALTTAAQSELGALRCIFVMPELLASDKLGTVHFSDPAFRDAFRSVRALYRSGKEAEAVVELAKRVARSGRAGQLTDATISGRESELFEKYCAELVSGFPLSARGKVLGLAESRRIKCATPPPEPVPRFYLAGKTIATPGNLCNFLAKSKSGKTAALGGVIASAVAAAGSRTGLDTLGFTASDPKDRALVVIDTEQSTYDAWKCYRRTLDRAEHEDDPPWLYVYGLAGYSALELREALPVIADNVSFTHGGIFAVCLDGVADFVTDVNDAAESNALVAMLQGMAITYDCSLLNVIHLNEGNMAGNKARGHLGSQLMRKGESNLLLQKADDVTTITSDLQRNAPITLEDGVAFRWSNEEGRHVSCAGPAESKAQAKKADLTELAVEAYAQDKALRYGDLITRIMSARDCSKNTADRRFTDMKRLGVIKVNLIGSYELVA